MFRQKEFSRIRMAIEIDAEHFRRFSLMPISRGPYTDDRINTCRRFVSFIDQRLNSETMIVLQRIELVNHFETWFLRIFVYSSNKREKIKSKIRIVFQKQADLTNFLRGYRDVYLPLKFIDSLNNFGRKSSGQLFLDLFLFH